MHLLLKLGRHSLNICSLKLKHTYIKTTEEVEHFATEFVFSLLPFEDKGCTSIVRNTGSCFKEDKPFEPFSGMCSFHLNQ